MDPLYKINIDGLRRCPYNPSHTVQALRFIGHLLKCSAKSPIKLMVCPWNATHHVHPEDYEVHMKTCESQEMLDGIGEIAVPDSAFVREYKNIKMLENMTQYDPNVDIVTLGGNVPLYYEPINTNHDYEVEVYNRRFQTQEFCTRDIDEFDNPTSNTQFDLYGNIIEREVFKDDNLPLIEENGVELDGGEDEEDSVHLDNCSVLSEENGVELDGGEDEEDGVHLDNGSVLSEESSVQCDINQHITETRYTSLDTTFWTGNNDLSFYVVDNKRFYYGRRLNFQNSDQDSSSHVDDQDSSSHVDDQDSSSHVDDQDSSSHVDDQRSNSDVIDTDQFTDATASTDDNSNVALDFDNTFSRPFKNENKVDRHARMLRMDGFREPISCASQNNEKKGLLVMKSSVSLSEHDNGRGRHLPSSARALAREQAASQPTTAPVEDTPLSTLEAVSTRAKEENVSHSPVTKSSVRFSECDNGRGRHPPSSARALAREKAASQPTTPPVEDTRRSTLEAVITRVKEENVSHSPVLQGPEGAMKPKAVPGYGRAYQLLKRFDLLQQEKKASDAGEAARLGGAAAVGHGRGIHLLRRFDEFRKENIRGRSKTTGVTGIEK